MCIPNSMGRIHTERERRRTWRMDEWKADWLDGWQLRKIGMYDWDGRRKRGWGMEDRIQWFCNFDVLWWMNMALLCPWPCTWSWTCTLVSLCLCNMLLLVRRNPRHGPDALPSLITLHFFSSNTPPIHFFFFISLNRWVYRSFWGPVSMWPSQGVMGYSSILK